MKASSTDFLMLDDLQSDIFAPDHKRISEFLSSPSLSPPSFLETFVSLKIAHGEKGREKAAVDEEQAKEWNENPLLAPT